jgi:hypothetical protein
VPVFGKDDDFLARALVCGHPPLDGRPPLQCRRLGPQRLGAGQGHGKPAANPLLMLTANIGFAVVADLDTQSHGMAADRAILDVGLVLSGRDIHGDDDLLAA